jgi:CrcB protein
LGSASPDRAGWPATTLLINIGGALALGALLQALTGAADSGWRRTVRLTLGTGLLGGFTTYSALVAETVELVVAGQASVAVGYALATVLLGGLASWVGLSAVKALQRTWGRR